MKTERAGVPGVGGDRIYDSELPRWSQAAFDRALDNIYPPITQEVQTDDKTDPVCV